MIVPADGVEQGDQEGEESIEGGDGEGGGASGDPQMQNKGNKKKSKSKANGTIWYEEEEEADLGPGEITGGQFTLGQLLMSDRVELGSSLRPRLARPLTFGKFRSLPKRTARPTHHDQHGPAGLEPRNQRLIAADSEYLLCRLGQKLKQRRDFSRAGARLRRATGSCSMPTHSGKRLREEMLRSVVSSNVEHRNFRLIQEMVYKMAKASTPHSRRRKVFKRGQLNAQDLRNNMSYDGAIFDLHWKSVKVDRPKVFAICDVLPAANYARFMLMFLHSLDEVMSAFAASPSPRIWPRSRNCSTATRSKTPSRKHSRLQRRFNGLRASAVGLR